MFSRVGACALALFLAASPASRAVAQQVTLNDEDVIARTDAVVDWAMQRPGAVALSVAVARDGQVLVDTGVGIADLEFDVPANRETSFRIGSLTKQFTAAAIMKLAERGKLSIDDDIGEYLPDFFADGSPLDLTHAQLLAFIDGVPFDFEPGTAWKYSNTGYYLLGMIIEAVYGRPYAQFVAQELFEPLGLTRTRYGSERDIIAALTSAEPPPLPEFRTSAQSGSEAAVRRMLEEIARGGPPAQ
jgi:CubicO group peptidase (beta-lactamase class C family)